MLSVHGLANFWQWGGADKLRGEVGWRERKPSFIDGMDHYRRAYEANGRATA